MKWGHTVRLVGLGLQSGMIGLVSKEAGRKHIIGKLSEIPGVPSKIAQFLNSRQDPSSRPKLHQQSAFNVDDVMVLLAGQHPVLFGALETIDEIPEVASLSQVHRGKLRTGEDVAIKIRFPNVAQEIEMQIDEYFEMFVRYGPSKGMDLDLERFKVFFLNSLLRELDYSHEANSQNRFRDFFGSEPWIRIPKVYESYTGDGLLVQSYESGSKPELLVHLDDPIKKKVVDSLLRFQLRSIFGLGCFHGDLHVGNWAYDLQNSCLLIYDFGSTQELHPAVQDSLKELVTLSGSDPQLYHQCWLRLGFESGLLLKIRNELPPLTELITEPFRSSDWSMDRWNLGERMNALLGENRWVFRLAGPPWFLGMMRSLQGLFSSLSLLNVPFSPSLLFQEVTGLNPGSMNFDSIMNGAPLSKRLRIEVSESGTPVVQLEFPPMNASRLAELIPSDVMKRIEKSGISIESVAQKAIESHFKPQELFSSCHQSRNYRVWLE